MWSNISEEDFQDSIEYYSSVLRTAYLEEIEDATDKEYAKQHFQKLLFLENEMIPYGSIIFNELRFSYNHFSRLNSKSSYTKTIELIPEIRKIGKTTHLEAKKYLLGAQEANLDEWYIERLENTSSSLEELIQLEALVLKSTNENLIGALAVHLAGQQLYKEFRKVKIGDKSQSEKHEHQFTRNEQILSLYLLIESFGVNLYQACDRTKLAALFHLIMGVPYGSSSKLKDLAIYKGLSVVPQIVKNDKQLLKHLNKIRSYFFNANFIKVVERIDAKISDLTSKFE